jgi:hypothetical protein
MKNEDFGKPIVVNSFTQFVPGHVHLKNLGVDLSEAALLPRMDPLIRSTTLARASKRWRGDRMRRRLPPSARPSVMSAAIFETGSKATTTPCCAGRPAGVWFSHAGGAVNRR